MERVRGKIADGRCVMYKNLHIDSVERNGVGIFRVLNWQAGAFVSKIIRMRIIQLRQNGGRSAKNQSELPQKAKVKCHKKPKLFG